MKLVSLREHCAWSETGIGNGEEMSLEAGPEDKQRRCRSDVLGLTVPDTSSGNRKGSVSNGGHIECGRRSVMKTRQNGVADDPRRPPLDAVHRRGTTVQTRECICIQGQLYYRLVYNSTHCMIIWVSGVDQNQRTWLRPALGHVTDAP